MNDADRHCGVREAAHCEGASFAWGTRAAATLLMLGLAALGWRNADLPLLAQPGRPALVYLLCAGVIVVAGYGHLMRSRTRIDATHLRQGVGADAQLLRAFEQLAYGTPGAAPQRRA